MVHRAPLLGLLAAATAPAAVPPLTCTPNLPSDHRTFFAGAWSSTCECTLPMNPRTPCNVSARSNFVCEEFDNIVPFAQLGCNLHVAGCRRGEYGTQAEWTVGCALNGNGQSSGYSKKTARCPGWPAQPGTAARQPGQPALLQLSNANLLLGTGANPPPIAADNILPANESACGQTNGLWADHALASLRTQSELFFKAYKAANGSVDELVLDWEGQFLYFPGGFRAGTSKQAAPDPCPGPPGSNASLTCLRCAAVKWRAIQADPRWPKAAAELHTMGFVLAADGDLATTMAALACADGWASSCARAQKLPRDRNRLVLGAYITELEARFWVQALEEPARIYFPEVRMSMYSFARWSPEHCLAP